MLLPARARGPAPVGTRARDLYNGVTRLR